MSESIADKWMTLEYCGQCGQMLKREKVVRCKQCGFTTCRECVEKGAKCWYCEVWVASLD